jgi:hypothetical protein
MPFTPAHPAVVLPLLRKKWLSATGLIIGSVAPDFEYFFKLSVDSQHSHTLPGLLYFDLPVTLVLSAVFHQVVTQNLIRNSPAFLQRRFQDTLKVEFTRFVASRWLIFTVSAIIGSASHIFWDGFTHGDGYFVKNLPDIYSHYVPYGGVKYPLFYALQHFSTVFGLASVALYILWKKPSEGTIVKPRIEYWLIVIAITGLVVLARFIIDGGNPVIGNQVVSLISGFCLAVIVTGLIKFRSITVNIPHGQENSVGAGRKA